MVVKKIRYQPLEPRILLDAAAAVTFAESTSDADQQNDLQNQIALSLERKAEARKVADPRPEIRNHQSDQPESETPAAILPTDLEATALVVVDTGVTGYEDLLTGLQPGTEILLIDAAENGLQKLADYVDGRDDITSIHILSHGDQGEFSLGTVTLNSDNIDQHADLLAQIGAALTGQGDLLLYGCRVAAEGAADGDDGKQPSGAEFVARIAEITGADVAASTDLTGAAAQDGDWDLEYSIGQMDGARLELTGFNGLLAPPTLTPDLGATDEDTPITVANDAPGTTTTDTDGTTTTVNADLLLNDTDPDGDILNITRVSGNTIVTAGSTTGGSNGGEFTIHADGSWRFDPGMAFNDLKTGEMRTTSVLYSASDGGPGVTTTLTVTVSGVNDAPVAGDDTGSTAENTVLRVAANAAGDNGANAGLLLNDNDPDGDLIITRVAGNTIVTAGSTTVGTGGGQFTVDADGAWRFDPGTAFDDLTTGESRITSVTYTVSDDSLTDTATLTVTVNGANDAPTAVDDAGATTENTELTVADDAPGTTITNDDSSTSTGPGGGAQRVNADLLLNDSDPESDTLTISRVAGSADNVGKATDGSNGGSFTISANGAWSFTPDSTFDDLATGETRITSVAYTAFDGSLTDTATLTVTVTGGNDAPTAVNDTGATAENTELTVADGATGTTSGTTTTNADLLLNDSDPDGDTLTISEVGGESANVGKATDGSNGGSFTISTNGAWSFNPGTGFDDLAIGATRATSVEYTATDGSQTDTATLTVTVSGANDGLTANADTGRTGKDRVLSVANDAAGGGNGLNADLLLNDVDIDGDSLTISAVGSTAQNLSAANLGGAITGNGGGRFTVRADGSWRFDPGTDFDNLAADTTRTASVVYRATDSNGETATATLTVTVYANFDPTAVDDAGSTAENTQLTVANDATGTNADLLLNDIDIDGDTLTISQVNGDADNVGVATRGTGGGQFTLYANGSWSFDPGTSFDDLAVGKTRTTSVDYTASDGSDTDTATLTVTVNGVNDGLTANADTGRTGENALLTVAVSDTGTTNANLLLNDVDIDGDTLTISQVGATADSLAAANVGTAIDGGNGGTFTLHADGSWEFNPGTSFDDLALGATRTTSVVYTASDGNGATAMATLTVTVSGAHDGLTPTADAGATTENAVLTVAKDAEGTNGVNAGLLRNDNELDGDGLTITRFVGGTINIPGSPGVGRSGGTFTIHADGAWRFDPGTAFDDLTTGESRTTSVEYRVSDSDGGSGGATLTVTVNGVNDAPTVVDDRGTTTENTALRVAADAVGVAGANAGLLLNDSDIDSDDLSISQVTGAANRVGMATAGSGGGLFTINTDGSWRFEPGTAFDDLADGKTRTTSVAYTVSDEDGGSTAATLTVTVTGTNDGLTANDDAGTTTENTQLTVADDAPGTTNADSATINADLLLNDVDIDGDDLTITEVGGESSSVGKATDGSDGGSFTIDSKGGWTFDPDGDFDNLAPGVAKTTSVVYTASDGSLTDTATLTVTVTGINDAPTALDDAGATTENTSLTVAANAAGVDGVNAGLLRNDSDPNGDDLMISRVFGRIGSQDESGNPGSPREGGNGGSFTINADGSWSFDPGTDFDNLAAGKTRTTTVSYTLSDGNGGRDTATLTVTVTGENDGLTANDDTGATAENTKLTIADDATGTIVTNDDGSTTTTNADLLLNDVDIDTADILTISEVGGKAANVGTATTGSNGGSFTISANGAWEFNPGTAFDDLAAGVTKTTSVVYTASDGSFTDTATLTVTVTGVNDAPVAANDAGTTAENTPLTVPNGATGTTNADLLLNDSDADTGDILTIIGVSSTAPDAGGTAAGAQGSPDDTVPMVVVPEVPPVAPPPVQPRIGGVQTQGSHGGSFTISTNGGWSFNPGTDFDDLAPGVTRTTSVVYTLSDGSLTDTDTATLTVTVTGENDDPTLTPAIGSVTEDTSVVSGNLVATGTVGASGGDAGEDQFMTDPVTGAYGSLTITADGTWSYTALNSRSEIQGLGASETLTDTLTVTSADGVTMTTVTITITGVNDAPVVKSNFGITAEDTVVTVAADAIGTPPQSHTLQQRVNAGLLLNDTDVDGDTLSISKVNGDTANVGVAVAVVSNRVSVGSFTIHADGSWSFDPDGDFNTLDVGGRGNSIIGFTVTDGHTETNQNLLLRITGVNSPPMANDDQGTTDEYTVRHVRVHQAGRLLLNDVDPENDAFTITAVGTSADKLAAANLDVAIDGSNGGSFTIGVFGDWRFDPDGDFSELQPGQSSTTSAIYQVTDDPGGTATATLTVTVTGANDAPTSVNDRGVADENNRLTVADGATGTTRIVTDGDGATMTIIENADLLLNDSDPNNDTLSVARVGTSEGALSAANLGKPTTGTSGGSFTINGDGSWVFDPGNSFHDLVPGGVTRTTSVAYAVSDSRGGTATATLTVTISGANDAPTALDDSATTNEDTGLTLATDAGLLANDSDPNNDLLFIFGVLQDGDYRTQVQLTDIHTPSLDRVVFANAKGTGGGLFTVRQLGAWSFDPGTDFQDLKVGETRITTLGYLILDGKGGEDRGLLTVTVTGLNDGPIAVDDVGTTLRSRVLTVAVDAAGVGGVNANLLGNDVDIDGDDLTITEVGGDTSSVGKATDGSDGGSFTIRADGSWDFDPGTAFNDLAAGVTRTTSVEYTASDGTLTDTATLTVTVRNVNTAPTATDDAGRIFRGRVLTVANDQPAVDGRNADLLLNDSDPDGDRLAITAVGDTTQNLSATGVGAVTRGTGGGRFTIHADGSWEFNPGTDFNDLATHAERTTSAVYRVSDSFGASDTATVTVTVTANAPPMAVDDLGATTENAALTVADGATGTIITNEDSSTSTVNADLLLNDSDAESDPLTITRVGGDTASVGKATDGSNGGSFTIHVNGAWSFNPGTAFDDLAAGATRTTSMAYTVSDGRDTETATLTVTVTGASDAPTANDDTGATTENAMLTVADGATGTNADLLLNDTDAESDPLTITEVGGDTSSVGKATDGSDGGSFTIRADGSWDFDPGTAFNDLKAGVTRTTSVEYTASDGTLTDTATLTVTVTGTNDGLTANDDAGTTTENKMLTVADGTTGTTNADLLLNDVDIDGDDLTITEVGGDTSSVGKATDGSDGGSFTIRADGSWDFDPGTAFDDLKAGVTKTTSVEYTASDGSLTDTATLTVTVTGTNDGLTANDDAGTTTENTDLTVADGATGITSGTTNADLLLNDVDIDGDDLTITEVDGESSSVGKAINGSDGGSFTLRANGSWEFNPGTDFDDLKAGVTKTTSVEYTASDGTLTDTATLTVTVTGANDGLTANDDAGTTTENTDLTVADGATGTTSGTTMVNADLLLNDTDADGDDLTITEVDGDTSSVGKATSGSDGGSFTIRANGSWEFNPGTDFDDLKAGVTRTTSVEYTASDGSLTDTATLTVTVTGANDGLTANDDAGTTTENTDLTVADGATGTTSGTTTTNADLLLNDVDIDGDDLTITEVDGDTSSVGKATSGSDGGSFTIRANGSWEFNPGTDFDDLKAGVTKTTSVEYTASDGSLTDTATLTVTVTGTNDGLTANDDAGTTTENTDLTVADGATGTNSGTTNADLLLNDVDIDGDDLTITEVDGDTGSVGKATSGSDGGSFTLRANGSWEFNPGTDFDDLKAGVTKTTSVEYTASDGTLTDTATLTVTVTGANDGLTANDDAGTTTENTELTVADGATGTTSGTTTTNADLLLNDVDIDGDDLTITEVGGESSSVGKATDGSDGGSFTIRANGSWEFNPGTDFDDLKAGVTKTTSVEYTASDGSLTDTATLTVTVTGTNDGLTANDDAGTTTENTELTVADGATGTTSGTTTTNADLLLNDVDIDGDDLTITEVDGDTSSVGKATNGSDGGSFTIRANGSWEFNPGTDFDDLKAGVTRTTSVEYTASDGSLTDTATLTVTVTGANDGLTANDDAGTTTENTELTVADGATGTTSGTTTTNADLLLNDVDIDGDDLTITEVDGDTSSVGKATDGSDGGSFTLRANGSWEFNPGTDFDDLKAGVTRTTSVEYTASDGSLTDTATLTVTVTGANDGLTANDDAGTTTENTDLTVADGATGTTSGTTTTNADLLLNDVDIDGDDLTITEVDGDTSSVGKATSGSDGGSFTIRANGSWEFNPGTDFDDLKAGVTKTTSVEYTASDGSLTDTATLTVTVTGTNDGLTANDDAGTTTENTDLTVADGATGTNSGTTNADLLLNDVDIDGDDLTITEVDGDTGSVGKATSGSDGGSFTLRANGSWEFNPGTDFDDLKAGVTRTTSVEYTASDGSLTDTATLTVTVTGTNDGLTANDDAGTTTENTELTVADGATGTTSGTTTINADLLLNDIDIDGDDLTITEVDGDTSSVGKATNGSDGGSFTLRANGSWEFNPGTDFDDLKAGVTKTTSVEYTASDGSLTDTATLTVTVTGANDGLTANDDSGTTTENTDLTVADGATGTTSGTTPGPGGGAQRVNADLLLNDVDIDSDDLTITEVDGDTSSVGKATNGSDGGSFTIRANGSWEFNPGTDFDDLKAGVTKTTSVEYTASDGSLTDTATLTVTVTGTNDGLTANDDAGTTTENTELTVADGATGTTSSTTTTNADLLLNDVDIDGDDLTITEVGGDTGSVGKATNGSDGGSFTIRANGSWEFNPGTDFDDLKAGVTKTTSVEYTASDGSLTDTATLTVTVTGTNDGLTANDDAGTTTENTDLTVADGATGTTNADLLLNDVDIDGDDLTITEVDGDTSSVGKATNGSDGGSFTIRANGSWEFNPGTDFDDLKAGVTRTTSVEYTASDGSLTDTATLTVTVTGANDGLTANDDAGTTTENTDLTVADGATGTTNADLLLNDVDIDGDDLTITEVDGDTSSVGKATGGSDGGSFTIRANGSWEFNPGTDFDDLKAGVTKTTSVEYTASDGSLTDTATLTVTVTGTNDGLTANDDAGTTTENTELTVADGDTGTRVGGGAQRVNADLLLNDVDIDGDDLTITEVDGESSSVGKATSGSDGGSFTLRANGSWEFNPGTDFDDLKAGVTKTTSVEYTASDGSLTDTATLTVTVTGTNDGLTANDDAGTTTENKMLTVADGATGTTSGTTTTNADLLLNDVDIDGDDLTITEVDGDTGSVGKATDGSDGGSFTIDSKGGWTFDPNSDFDDLAAGVTRTTSVVYTASDGTLTDTATLTVTVTGTNDGLTANDDAGTTTENKMLTVADGATGTTSGTTTTNADLLLNDVDIDGDDLTITEVDGDTGSVGKATDGSDGGSFTIDSKGGWTFDPNSDFDDLAAGVTRTTSVVYTASDGTLTDTATLTVTVTGTNDGLTANDDAGTTTENKMLTVADGATGTTSGTTPGPGGGAQRVNADLLLNDVDIDGDDLTITEVDGDTSSVGKATDGSDGGSFTIDSKGGWTFDPNSDFDDLAAGVTRTTSVVYTASDGTLTDTATLTVTVTGTNDGLTANDDAGTTTENTDLTVADGATGTTSGTTPGPGGGAQRVNADLLLNDVDIDGDDLTITEVDGDTGSVGKATDGSDGGSFTIDSKGGWTFDPNSDFDDLAAGVTRTTSVVYTASDGTLTDTATLTVTVTGTNDGLTANDDAGTTTENKMLTVADGATGTTSGTTTTNADLLLNDVDIDGDDLTITEVDGDTGSVGKATDGSDGGSFTIDSKGGWTFDPNSDFDDLAAGVTRTTSVVYTASDGTLTDTATLTVTVTGTNDGLTANDDAGTTTENKMLTVADGATGTTSGTTPGPGGGAQRVNADLLLNDVDIDGDDLTITEVDGDTGSVGKATDGSDGGSFTIDSKGGWTFDPNSDFDDLAAGVTRTTSVVYTASDGTLTDTATLTVTVTGTNDGLTANDDAGTTTENKMLTVADGATGTTSGTTPGPGGGAQRANADLLLNDVDIDGDDLTITEVDGDTGSVGKATDGSDGGSFTIDSKGGWTFDPNSDFDDLAAGVTRTTSVVYTASDGTLTDTATLTVTVTGTNDGLTANDDAGTTTENKMLTVADGATGTTSGTTPGPGGGAQRVNADLLLNDVDIDGDDLTITEVDGDTGSVGKATDGSDGGSFTIDSKGGWTFDPNSDFDDLAAGVTRTTSVVYTASDGTLTDTATLTVTVTGTNDGLTANDDAGTTTENTELTVADGATGTTSGTTPGPGGGAQRVNADLLLNDVDIDSDDLTITEVDGESSSVGKATDGSDGGSFTIDSKGGWTFDPNSDFDDLAAGVTRTTSVVYTASDGTLTDTATLTVTVTGTNDGLTANDDAGTTTENKMLTVADGATGTTSGTTTINADLLLNDVDIDGDDLTITEVDGDTGSVGKATDGSDGGSFTIDSKGGWAFDPNSDFDDLAAGVTRTTSVVYTASDGTLTDTATLTVTVTGTNDGLTANDDAGTTTENKMLTVADGATGTTSGTTTTNADLLLNDVDIDGDDLTITEVDGDTGSVGKATDGSDGGSFTIDSKGGWTFDPNSDFDDLAAGVTRTTSVVYTASDGTLTDTATLTVTVTGTNDGLTANDDAGTTTENTELTVADGATGTTSGTTTGPGGGAQRVNADLLLNDVDIDGDDLTITEVDGDTGSVGKATDGSDGGSFTIDSKGGWTFDPNSDFDDLKAGVTRTTSVEYTASDGTLTDTATLTVTVTGANDGLTANDDAGTTTENKMLTVADGATGTTSGTTNADLLLNDVDIDGDDLTITEVDGDTGSVGKATDGSDGGSFTIDSKGGWTFDPNSDFDDLAAGVTRTTSVEYTASDGTLTDTATLTVTVTGSNDGLTANDDAGTTTENTELTVADGATGTMTVNRDLLLNDVDIDSDDLTITEVDGDTSSVGKATNGSDGGSFTLRANGSWEFNPGTDFDDLKAGVTKTTSVEYTASDGSLTDTATLTVTVTGSNDGLTANDDAGTTTENTELTVADGATGPNADLLLNDVDIDSDDLTITEVDGESSSVGKATSGSDGGSFTIRANGSWEFNPGTDFDDLKAGVTRTTSVEYTASDGTLTDTATLTVTVRGTNDGLTANDDAGTTTENTELTVADGATGTTSGTTKVNADLLLNDKDDDGDTLTISEVGGDTASVGKAIDGSDGGKFTIRANGSWEFNPGKAFDDLKAGVTRTTSVEYTASDGTLTDTATLTVTVTGANDGLTANDDAGTTTENTDLIVADGATGTTSGTTPGPGGGAQRVNADLLLNDVDIDSDDLTITEVDGDTGSVGKATTGSGGGSFTIRADGSWDFNPGTAFDDLKAGVTRTTSVEYTASDGTLTDTATLTVTVTGTNDGLTANDDAGTTTENTELTVADGATGTTSGTTPGPGGGAQRVNADLLLNDVDIDGDDLTITEVDGESSSVGKATSGSDGGSFTIRANGSWEFNPGTDFDDLKAGVTKTTSVEYTASDGSLTDTATLTVTVTGANDGLTANDDSGTTTENTELTVADGATGITSGTTNADLLLNDVDIDGDDLTITEVDGDTSSVGKATSGSDGGSFTIRANGSWEFNPGTDFDDLKAGVTKTTSVHRLRWQSHGHGDPDGDGDRYQ